MVKLGSIASITTGKLDSNAAEPDGVYPFFTCSPDTLRINTYAFDQEAILLAGNNAEGNYTAKYYNGKFNAYQRTYVIASLDPHSYSTRFIGYAITLALKQLKEISQGTSTKFLTKAILQDLDIPDFLLPDQLRVVSIIGSMEDCIGTLDRINDNLEHICKAHYRRMVSKSLETVLLSDLAEVCYGKDHKHLDDGIYPVYGSGGIMRYCERPLYQGKESVLIPRKGTLNNVMFVSEPFWSVDTMFYTKMKNEYAGKYLYFWLSELNLADMNSGSAVPSMTTEILYDIEVRYPGDAEIESFDKSIQPMFDLMKYNEQQITQLTKLRDYLLPKLMSGEIDLSTLKIPTKYSFSTSNLSYE